MARTALFGLLQRSFRKARLLEQDDSGFVRELLESGNWPGQSSRRDFLRRAAGTAAVVGISSAIPGCLRPEKRVTQRKSPKIAIVGAGMAGLNAAYTLRKQGVGAAIFEASARTGGRMWSAQDMLAPGLITELGGEFIDSGHDDMFALIDEFQLPLLDMNEDARAELVEDACFFGGRHYKEAEIVEAFRPIAIKMQSDFDGLGETIDYQNEGRATALDRTSLADYLHRLGGASFLIALLEVAYVTEFGLDAHEQSALNLLTLIGLDSSEGFSVFGESDERYKVHGGNQRVTHELTKRLAGHVVGEQRLTAVRARGTGFTLTFERKGGGTRDLNADFVVMTIPFSVLREVEMDIDLPPLKRRAIDELGYGTNAKMLLGFHAPASRTLGYSGNVLTDEAFQLGWDNSRLQKNAHAGFTMYSGGKAGVEIGTGTPANQAARLMPGLSAVFPELADRSNGRIERFHWPSFPHSRGSYSCYKPGQWTTIRGGEGESVGNLHFAGEHCSRDFQGYMNGAAETGRLAGEAVLATIRGGFRADSYVSRRSFVMAGK